MVKNKKEIKKKVQIGKTEGVVSNSGPNPNPNLQKKITQTNKKTGGVPVTKGARRVTDHGCLI
jgi:hypothetical protein